MRLVVLSMSLATIMLSSVFRQFSEPRNRLLYHWQREDAMGLSAAVLTLTLLITAAAYACRKGGERGRTWAKVAAVLLLVDAGLGHILDVSDAPPSVAYLLAASVLLVPSVTLGWMWAARCGNGANGYC